MAFSSARDHPFRLWHHGDFATFRNHAGLSVAGDERNFLVGEMEPGPIAGCGSGRHDLAVLARNIDLSARHSARCGFFHRRSTVIGRRIAIRAACRKGWWRTGDRIGGFVVRDFDRKASIEQETCEFKNRCAKRKSKATKRTASWPSDFER